MQVYTANDLLDQLESLELVWGMLNDEELAAEKVSAKDFLMLVRLFRVLPSLFVEKGASISVTLTTYKGSQGNP